MVFWGCEVKPGKTVQEVPPPPGYTLHVTQATLGQNPKDGERSVVKCRTQDKEWIYLCSLTGGATESCQLDLMFEDEVTFAISGRTSVHLVGYLMPSHDHDHEDEDDEDYEMDYSTDDEEEDFEEEEDDDEEDEMDSEEEDEDLMTKPKSSVVIEEIDDEEAGPSAKEAVTESKAIAKATNGIGKKQQEASGKAGKAAGGGELATQAGKQAAASAAKGKVAEVKEEEMAEEGGEEDDDEDEDEDDGDEDGEEEEDEDGFMAAKKRPAKAAVEAKEAKRQAVLGKGTDKPSAATPAKTPPKPAAPEQPSTGKGAKGDTGKTPSKSDTPGQQSAAKAAEKTPAKTPGKQERAAGTPKSAGADASKAKDSSLFVKTFPNGFQIETTAIGRPDAKPAKQGSRVFVKYVGRLKSNNKIFDQSSKSPFSFRLGVGEVIKGWDVGLQGMRVGDKRKLVIPPAMAYGVKGAPPQIPGNSWLLFDVELCDVK